MSTSSHPRGAEGRADAGSASVRPSGLDPQFYTALGAVTCAAIEAETRRHQAYTDLYLSLVREVFAVTDDGSDETCPSTDPSSVLAPIDDARRADSLLGGRDATTRASSVRAGAQDAAGGAAVQPGASGIALETK